MNRRSVLKFLGCAPIPYATDTQAICCIVGHKMEFDYNSELEEKDYIDGKGKGWWWEWFKCSRCGAKSRMLVAGPRG